ncbi:hypothetical protein C1646_757564 [Rhizophagus diaphanus]|nr:hypothetical protein C1646_757564 [Rhizophagus diaphanus] [Rhizophagus sp. MUCL 43196]
MKICSWLRKSGTVETNFKDTLESTINELYINCPLGVPKESLYQSLKDIVKSDEEFCKKSPVHVKISGWLKEVASKQSEPTARFAKTRISKTEINKNTRSSTPPPINEKFSLSRERQGAIVERFYTVVESELYKFLVENENIIPARVVESFIKRRKPPLSPDFRNADLLSMINFIIKHVGIFLQKSVFHGEHKVNPVKILKDYKEKVRHKLAHGISMNEKGRWSDLAIQNVAHLSCQVVACIGGNYEDVYAFREKVNGEIARQSMKRAAAEDSEESIMNKARPEKRKRNEMINFVLNIFEEIEEIKEGQKKEILKMALQKDEIFVKIWEIVKMQETKKQQVSKFTKLMNIMFDINLKEL